MAQMWNYGTAPATSTPVQADPYQAGLLQILPDITAGISGSQQGQFNGPRGVAVAPDGTIYVADTGNNRIVHYAADLSKVINSWGTFADVLKGAAPAGTSTNPGVLRSGKMARCMWPIPSISASKNWPDGTFIKMWGYFGQAEKPEAFWGPRGLAFDQQAGCL